MKAHIECNACFDSLWFEKLEPNDLMDIYFRVLGYLYVKHTKPFLDLVVQCVSHAIR